MWMPGKSGVMPTAPKCQVRFENWREVNQAAVYAPVA